MMSRKNKDVFRNAVSVLHFDVKESTDAKGNAIIWKSNPSFTPGKFGNALSAGKCVVNLPEATANLKTFTVSCWLKVFNKSGSDYGSVRVNQDPDYSLPCGIGFNAYQNGNVTLLIGNGGNGWLDSTTLLGNIPMDSFYHHFEMTYNSGVITTFVDGIKQVSITKSLPGMTDYRRIGVAAGSLSYIDEVVYMSEILHTGNFTPPSKPYR